MTSEFDRLFSDGALWHLLDYHGQAVSYTPEGGAAASITAVVNYLETENRNDERGRVKIRRARLTCTDDPANADYGGVADPQLTATVTIDSEDWSVAGRGPHAGGMIEIHLERYERMENTREGYRR